MFTTYQLVQDCATTVVSVEGEGMMIDIAISQIALAVSRSTSDLTRQILLQDGGFHGHGVPPNGWYYRGNPNEMDDDWGYPYDSGNLQCTAIRYVVIFDVLPPANHKFLSDG